MSKISRHTYPPVFLYAIGDRTDNKVGFFGANVVILINNGHSKEILKTII